MPFLQSLASIYIYNYIKEARKRACGCLSVLFFTKDTLWFVTLDIVKTRYRVVSTLQILFYWIFTFAFRFVFYDGHLSIIGIACRKRKKERGGGKREKVMLLGVVFCFIRDLDIERQCAWCIWEGCCVHFIIYIYIFTHKYSCIR